MVVRNDRGVDATVPMSKLRPRKDAPVRLARGTALTIDAEQGVTADEKIHPLIGGAALVGGNKGYTGGTRHERAMWLVVDDAAERRAIVAARPRGGTEVHATNRERCAGASRP